MYGGKETPSQIEETKKADRETIDSSDRKLFMRLQMLLLYIT